jgi:signal transduction histidine kinase
VDPDELQAAAQSDSGRVGRFHPAGDSVFYATVAPVRDSGKVLGYVAYWRRLTTTTQARDAIVRLIGEAAGLYLGNDRGDGWNDMVKAVPPPPTDVRPGAGLAAYERPGAGKMLGLARAIPGTSWVVLLEFPRSVIDLPVRGFLRRLAVIAVIVLGIGLVTTLAVSQTITGPLGELTRAAEATAAGDYTQRVTVRHQDEVARVARSFNTMVDRVRESQATLEERVQERTRELQERNDDLEAFGYSISHDLRAPLRAMQGFSQIILEDYGDRLDDKGRQHAQRIVVAAKRMDELIRDLLAYSRLSRATLETAPVNLQNVVTEALSQLEAELQRTGARVQVGEPLPTVRGHQSTLSQVVANLLGNSMKFVPPGRNPEVKVRAEPRNGQVRLWVEDNGIGILPEHQQRIFNVFERLHANDQYPGTGIGLAIVKKGMERMGGTAGVESEVNSGSRFWIELPRVEPS